MGMAAEHRTTAVADDVDRRWDRLWDGFFLVSLAVPTVLAVLDADGPAAAATVAGTAAALGLWHWLMAPRLPEPAAPRRALVWYVGAVVGLVLLVRLDATYFMLLYGLFPQVFGRLDRWAIPGAIGLSLAFFAGSAGHAASAGAWLLNFGTTVVMSVLIGLFVTAVTRQSDERREALRALEATRAELAAAARHAGVLEERARIARDLHDTVAQGFTGIVVQLEVADDALDRDPTAARAHLDRARASAREGLAEMRRAVRDLRPELLDDVGLSEAVRRTAARWSEATGVPAAVTTSGTPSALPPEAEVALLRAAQEALANVAKHARATAVTVTLAYDGDAVTLRVDDDGIGLAAEGGTASAEPGLGLLGMRERLAALGGRLDVASPPGGGTRVAATVVTR